MNWKLLDVDIGNFSPYQPSHKNIAPLAVAAIGAGASILGSIAGSAMQNSANSSMDRETREWQEMMWNKNNNYNLPVNQRKRLEDAGINPALAMQNGNTGVASSAPNAVNHTPADFSGIGAGISSGAQYFLQAQQVEANNELALSQAESFRIGNMTKLAESMSDIYLKLAQAKKAGSDTSWLQWQLDKDRSLYDAYSKKAYADIENMQADTFLKRAQEKEVSARISYQEILNKFAPEQQKLITSNLFKEGSKIMSEVNKNNREAAVAIAEKALKEAQKRGVSLSNQQISEMSQYVVDEQFYKSETERYRAGNERKRYYGGRVGQELPSLPFVEDDKYNRHTAPKKRK